MSDYRYITFPPHRQPTVDEAAELANYSSVLSGRLAIGVHRRTGGLVIACEARHFDRAKAGHRGFASLVERWEVRGAEVVECCPFVKDAAALRPMPPNIWSPVGDEPGDRGSNYASRLAGKELAAKEAIGRSLLGVQQTLERHAAIQRFAAFMPYLLIGVATIGIVLVGFHVGRRLLDSGIERRRDTTERVLHDPMVESLDAK